MGDAASAGVSIHGADDPQRPVALVTGSTAPRVGRAIAAVLHQAGYRIVLQGNRSAAASDGVAESWSAAGGRTVALQADLRSASEIQRLADLTFQQFERLDVLVHAASRWRRARLEDLDEAAIDEDCAIHVKGTFLLLREFGLRCCAFPQGSTFIVLGDAAIGRPYLDHASYFATKGAIPAMVRTFAKELASRNPRMRVLGLDPGPLAVSSETRAQLLERAERGQLIERACTDHDVAQAVLALVSLKGLQGATLTLDGGRGLVSAEHDLP